MAAGAGGTAAAAAAAGSSAAASGSSQGSSGKGSSNKAIVAAFQRAKRQKADKAVAKFFYGEGIAFNKAKSPFFIDMVNAIAACPGYKPPAYNAVRTNLLDDAKHGTDRDLLLFDKRSAQTKCTVTSDGWSDPVSHPLLNILAVNPIGAKFLTAVNTEGEVKSGLYIATALLEAIDGVGAENVVQVVTDGASNCTSAGRIVMDK